MTFISRFGNMQVTDEPTYKSEKGQPNGIPSLDGSGTIPLNQIPNSIQGGIKVIGFWDASTNTPDLSLLTLLQGQAYQVSVDGNTNLNGTTNWQQFDLAVWDDVLAGNWFKIDNTDAVITVFGRTGAITPQNGDYTASQVTNAFDKVVDDTDDIIEGIVNRFNASHTGEVTGSVALTITANAVTNGKLAQVPTATFKGRASALTGNVEDLTVEQTTALLNVFTTLLKGLVPASGGGTTNYLRADGSWALPPSGNNIYNSDGTLVSDRIVTMNGNTLVFDGALGQAIIRMLATNESYLQFARGNEFVAWSIGKNADGNEHFTIKRFNEIGAFVDTPFQINIATGKITFNGAYTFPVTDGTAGQSPQTDGAGNVTWVTPTSPTEKRIGQDYAYNLSGAGGFTWNGIINIGSTAIVTLLQRWRLQAFVGTGQPDGCFTNFILPNTYVSGNSIKINITSTENGVGGNIKYWVGVGKPTVANTFGGELDTQWLPIVHTALAGFVLDNISLTFLGTNLVAGEPISVMIFRDPADPQDTFAGDSYINSISAEQT